MPLEKKPTDSACGEAISVFILLASFQKSTLCTSKSQTDPIDLFCAISAKHMQEFQLCHISQLEPGHDSVASRLHMIPVKHTAAFTHRRFYIQTLLYRITFTQTDFYTQAPLLKDALHTNTFTKKPFHTLEKNWIIRVIRRELNPITCSSTRLYYIYNYNYIWDYAGHQLRLKCAQVHHQSPAGTFSRVPGKWLRRSPTPTGPR